MIAVFRPDPGQSFSLRDLLMALTVLASFPPAVVCFVVALHRVEHRAQSGAVVVTVLEGISDVLEGEHSGLLEATGRSLTLVDVRGGTDTVAVERFTFEDDVITADPTDVILVHEVRAAATRGPARIVGIAHGMRGLGRVRGVRIGLEDRPRPLFSYWIDVDGDGRIVPAAAGGRDRLHGDSNRDGRLAGAELPVGPVAAADLPHVLRVDVSLPLTEIRTETRVGGDARIVLASLNGA